ncbi:ectoine hydrolase DoeA, partial [Mesorhizobium waimense]
MSAEVLRFELSEYKIRLEKARNAMEKAGIDLLIVTDPANMAWLTGYDGNAFYVPQCVVVS